ncbi:MAG: aminoacyl-tRNA hydrolase [Parcubacteria group bacterium]|jgi:PTH1 family peptidyl-tRNA hydrolase
MKLIFGLGNPGKEYEHTRHNVGFEIVDKLQRDWNFSPWEFNKKFNAEISKGNDTLLVKPRTFMNLSGEAVRSILTFYKLTPDDIIVIHDDLDIPVGKYKVATDSSSAGHHGVENIIEKLGTQKFKRIRIGIGEDNSDEDTCRLGAHDYVLDKFSEEEKEKIKNIENDVLSEIKKLL